MITHIWTSWNGTKTPIHLMSDEHLKNSYIRCLEVICAENYKARATSFNGASAILSEMDSSLLTKDKAEKWLDYFKKEFAKRKLKVPRVNRTNIDFQFTDKQMRKKLKIQSNKDFDNKFI